jgi:choline kinase
MRTAVILGAGVGRRLGHIGVRRPKGFLRLGSRPLVEEAVLRLRLAEIDRVIVVTGHCKAYYDRLRRQYSGILTTVHNPRYRESGSLYSLYCARELLDEAFLLLESDLIFEQRALEALLSFPKADCVLLGGPSGAGDEVFVWSRPNGSVSCISKRLVAHELPAGELVGISKISPSLFAHMVAEAERLFPRSIRVDYETDCLDALAQSLEIPYRLVPDLLWAEIDDAAHLDRARTQIYPRITPLPPRPFMEAR